MNAMKISIKKIHAAATLPEYATEHAAGMDLVAAIDTSVELKSLERTVITSGIAIALPAGYEAQVRARSGLSLKHGITAANGVGTIDADFRGEVGVILVNMSNESFTITPGMRIAQLIISKYEKVQWQEVDALDDTERGEGGYGSTGH